MQAKKKVATKRKQQLVREALDDAKAQDVSVLDVRKIADFADYMIVASGTSSRHVASMADKVVDAMREHGVRAQGVEGKDTGEWVLIDFGDVIVHLMRPQTREFYALEKLWGADLRQGADEGLEEAPPKVKRVRKRP
jgi:ribosome-associated protein